MLKLIVFMGPSGVGKSKLQDELNANKIVTYTSREPRLGEVDGINYHFTNKESIINMYNNQELLEYSEYNGNYYGMSYESINRSLSSNKIFSIISDINGVKMLKDKYDSSIIVIGIYADKDQCIENLSKRKNDHNNLRIDNYDHEIEYLYKSSDIIINNNKVNWSKSIEIIKRFNPL